MSLDLICLRFQGRISINVFRKLVHQAHHQTRPMKMTYGDQHQTHWKLLLQKNRHHANANPDHKNHLLVLRANLAAVQTIRPLQLVHSMKDVPFQKHVRKPNSDVVRMVFLLLLARNSRDAQNHCVRAVCSDVAHRTARLKLKDPTMKVCNGFAFSSSLFWTLVYILPQYSQTEAVQRIQLTKNLMIFPFKYFRMSNHYNNYNHTKTNNNAQAKEERRQKRQTQT